jgi:hypothetical protein
MAATSGVTNETPGAARRIAGGAVKKVRGFIGRLARATPYFGMAGVALIVGLAIGYSVQHPVNGPQGATTLYLVEDNTKDVLIPLITAGAGLAGGLIVAFVGFSREDRHRFTAHKAEAYSKLLNSAELARNAICDACAGGTAAAQSAGNRYDEMSAAVDIGRLLGSREVREGATELRDVVLSFVNSINDITKIPAADRDSATNEHNVQVGNRVETLIAAMQKDLGLH